MSERFSAKQYFSFVCPPDREGEARLTLGNIKNVSVADFASTTTRVIPDENNVFQELTGTEISGTCEDEACEELLHTLAGAEIAGYSRVTQILFRDPSVPNETILKISEDSM